jgi:DNA-binding winged helix-turn-helix (wHTH) protein
VSGPVYEFDEFTVDCDRFELRRRDQVIRLERKPLELLILLISCRERIVTREEIADRLWGSEVFVDVEHGINTAIRKIRAALADDPAEPRFIRTVTGQGLQLDLMKICFRSASLRTDAGLFLKKFCRRPKATDPQSTWRPRVEVHAH